MLKNRSATNKSTRLLSLPPELRNMIYRLAFADDPGRKDHFICLWPGMRDRVPALLQTCRQIDKEAGSIYYAERTFRFVWEHELLLFSRALSPSKRRAITSLRAAFLSGATVQRASRKLKRIYGQMVACGLDADIRFDVLSAEVVLLPNMKIDILWNDGRVSARD